MVNRVRLNMKALTQCQSNVFFKNWFLVKSKGTSAPNRQTEHPQREGVRRPNCAFQEQPSVWAQGLNAEDEQEYSRHFTIFRFGYSLYSQVRAYCCSQKAHSRPNLRNWFPKNHITKGPMTYFTLGEFGLTGHWQDLLTRKYSRK